MLDTLRYQFHFLIMFTLTIAVICILGFVVLLWLASNRKRHAKRLFSRRVTFASGGFPAAKPAWVKPAILELHEQLGVSHRKLAAAFNHVYFASTGISVGRTWVRETLKKHEYEKLHIQKTLKHRVPRFLKKNAIWGIDTTCVRDASLKQHIVLGIIDHGSRMNVLLQNVKRFNAWTFLEYLFLTIGMYGKPKAIKMDNHQVFRSQLVKQVCAWVGVRLRFSEPGKPWQNGRIERFFGTLKVALKRYVIQDGWHLIQSIEQFQLWYNVTRPHQHLKGFTPMNVWCGQDPLRSIPKDVAIYSAWNSTLKGLVLRQ